MYVLTATPTWEARVPALSERVLATMDEQIANLVVAELLHLESQQSDRGIAIYVNSPGG